MRSTKPGRAKSESIDHRGNEERIRRIAAESFQPALRVAAISEPQYPDHAIRNPTTDGAQRIRLSQLSAIEMIAVADHHINTGFSYGQYPVYPAGRIDEVDVGYYYHTARRYHNPNAHRCSLAAIFR